MLLHRQQKPNFIYFQITHDQNSMRISIVDTTPIPSMNPISAPTSLWWPLNDLATRSASAKDQYCRIHHGSAALAASQWTRSFTRRLLDLSVALTALAVFALPMLVIALMVRLTSPGPALFTQRRMGRNGRLFLIYKFRSMGVPASGTKGPGLTRDGDSRITPLGKWLRKLKLDELPQFINVLRGDMSLVGPRPKLPQYEQLHNMPYRPGITGAATLYFRNEEEMLRHVSRANLDVFYAQYIQPVKAQLDADYMSRATFWTDLKLIAHTFLACLKPERVPLLQNSQFNGGTTVTQQLFETVN